MPHFISEQQRSHMMILQCMPCFCSRWYGSEWSGFSLHMWTYL